MGRPKKNKNVECSVEGCQDKCYKFKNDKPFCARHYQQLLKHNRITVYRNPRELNEIEIDYDNNIAYICLYNLKGIVIAKAIIDIESIPLVENIKWCIDKNNYIINTTSGKIIYLHRLLGLGQDNNDSPFDNKYIIKHKNHNKLDNRISNLLKIRINK